jgi:hypothetical protein
MGKGCSESKVMTGITHMYMGIFMGHHRQPMRWLDSAHINQNKTGRLL